MRRLLAATVLPLVLAACGDNGPNVAAQYHEAVRCDNAASTFAQQYVVAGDTEGYGRITGYAWELKAKAVALGGKLGMSESAVAGETQGAQDAAYVHKFFRFTPGAMTPTDFGTGEIAHCNLNAVLQ